MKKEILKFVTGTLVNVLMSIIILSLLGLPFAGWLGLVTGIVLPMLLGNCLLYTSPSPRDRTRSRMPSSA